jgi:hypothetical protein
MDAETVDTDLVSAVRDAATPEERAALLGVDYERLVATRRRFQIQSMAVCAAAALVVVLVALFSSPTLDAPGFSGYFAGAGIVIGLVLAAFLAAQVIGAVVSSRVATRITESIVVAVYSVGTAAALLASTALATTESTFIGVLVGSALAPVFAFVGVTALPSVIRSNHPKTVAIVRAQQQMPGWQTLLGGRTRWLLAGLAVNIVYFVAVVVILDQVALAFVPVAALLLASDLAGLAVGRTGTPWRWLAIQGSSTVVLVVLAVLISA